jgi:beta-N-acetylhexosaminidase
VKSIPLGPVMVDVAAHVMSDAERERLCHPSVGGVILFARNYRDREQLSALCDDIHQLRTPSLLIAIDHEGGRVQRCREGFTRIPSMRDLGRWYERDARAALLGTHAIGYVMAIELREVGVDFTFAPVLDLDWGQSSVIGDRAFHAQPEVVIALANALIAGMQEAGMGSCGKHFPGHGWVKADSHLALPIDERSLDEIATDLRPFREVRCSALMPAHVIYEQVDHRTAGFSPVWHGMLRGELGFTGVVFSDDLSMEGASVVGGMVERARSAWEAGCDMLLVCNAPDEADHLLANWTPNADAVRSARVQALMPTVPVDVLKENPALALRYQAGLSAVASVAAGVCI